MQLKLDNRFKKNLQGRFGKYDFEVGVLSDAPYKTPKYAEAPTTYAGDLVRRKSRKDSGLMISEVSKENRDRLGFNFYQEPFRKKTSDIVKFTDEFFKLAFGHSEKRRAENLLQAIVRNPILRGEYGPSSEVTNQIKGFDRPMIDTAQLFKAIKAKCTVRGGK